MKRTLQVSDFQNIILNWVKKKIYIEKPENFIKLLTERISYIELSKLVSMVVIWWFLSERIIGLNLCFLGVRKTFPSINYDLQ